MALIAGLSLVILYAVAPVRRVRPNWQMFFLGAGFMLLETKGVVHMALLFGSTWLVNSVVFFAILVMILASNVFVLLVKPQKLWPYYVLLSAALLVNILVPMSRFLALPGWGKVAVSCAVIFVPIFFAGIVFGTSFRDSTSARRRFRFQHRGRDPGWPGGKSVADDWLQLPADHCSGLLCALGRAEAAVPFRAGARSLSEAGARPGSL